VTYGLYIGNESRPIETGEQNQLRELVKHLTPQQRRDGWTIAPVNFEWPAQVSQENRRRNPIWVGLGILFLLFTLLVLIQCSRS
jgi:hypothetical protein